MLRPVTESDGAGLFDIFNDDQVTEHYAWERFTSLAQAQELAASTAEQIRRGEALRWGLVPHGQTQIIGTCGYTRWIRDHHFAILGYDLARRFWRQGLMSEAVSAVLRLGFDEMDLNRVEALVMTGNTASAAVLRRMGFAHEGEMRERALHRGSYRNVQVFGLTRADWVTGTPGRAQAEPHSSAGPGRP